MSATEVEGLRAELKTMQDKAAKNGPKAGSTASLRTGAGGRIESVLIRFGTPVDPADGDELVASLEAWADDIHSDADAEPEEV